MDIIIAVEQDLDAMQRLGLGGKTLLIGLVMVFLVLGILIGVVTLIRILMPKFEAFNNKRHEAKAERKKAKAEAKASANAIEAPKSESAVVASNDEEVVAAISAAISMYYEAQYASVGKSVKFRVRSIKEIR